MQFFFFVASGTDLYIVICTIVWRTGFAAVLKEGEASPHALTMSHVYFKKDSRNTFHIARHILCNITVGIETF